nr:hypothetical protein NG677_04440 [Methylobacterium sp. OTU13CASTA1]
MSASIKTSYDRTILAMAAGGASSAEVSAATGRNADQIRNRAMRLGVWRTLVRNLRDRRLALKGERRCIENTSYNGRSALGLAAIPPARVDRSASDLRHALRVAQRRADPAVAVPDSFIARVFDAGLTLDDIDAQFGVPPVQAVAAIRHHLEIRP